MTFGDVSNGFETLAEITEGDEILKGIACDDPGFGSDTDEIADLVNPGRRGITRLKFRT